MKKSQSDVIRKLGREAGEKYAQDEAADAAKLYLPEKRADELVHAGEKIQDIVYNQTTFPEELDKRDWNPNSYKATVISDETVRTAYVANGNRRPRIVLGPCVRDDNVNVVFHEAAHAHLQHLKITGSVLENVRPVEALDDEFYKLMQNNLNYYLSVNNIEKDGKPLAQVMDATSDRKAWFAMRYNEEKMYSNSPLERFSNLYGTEAERAFRRVSGQLTERGARDVAMFLDSTMFFQGVEKPMTALGKPNAAVSVENGIRLTYSASEKGVAADELLKGIEQRFAGMDEALKKQLNIQKSVSGEVSITIPQSYDFRQKFAQFKATTQLPPPPPVISQELTEEPKKTPFEMTAEPNGEIKGETAKKSPENTIKAAADEVSKKFDERVTANATTKATAKTATNRALKGTLKNQSKNALLRANAAYDKWFDNAVAGVMKWNAPKGLKNATLKVDNAAGKMINNRATQAAKQKLDRAAAAFAQTEAGKKIQKKLTEAAVKMGGEAGAKYLAKKIPLLSLACGLYFGGKRLLNGEVVKACGEVLSGTAGCVPVYGTAASLGIDGALLADDLKKAGVNLSAKEAATLLRDSLGGGKIEAEHNPYAQESTRVARPPVVYTIKRKQPNQR